MVFIVLSLVVLLYLGALFRQYLYINEGEALSKIHCQSCHLYPEPSLLDRETWDGVVLPAMRKRLGLFDPGQTPSRLFVQKGIYPKHPVIHIDDWTKIEYFYLSQAPEVLKKKLVNSIKSHISEFEINLIPKVQVEPANITLVKIDEQDSSLYVSDANNGSLQKIDNKGNVKRSFPALGPTSHILIDDDKLLMTTMGLVHPHDQALGKLYSFNLSGNADYQLTIDSLYRPLDTKRADLNNDGTNDLIISSFGNFIGDLSWYEGRGKSYIKHVLKNISGAVKTELSDINRDGLPDIVALMAQGNEGVFIFYNSGNGKFAEQQVIEIPPSYGSNYFELKDFNRDNYPDILLSSGDNGDYKPILKYYQGIRIFQNEKNGRFNEVFFFPIHGVSRSIAADFDLDNDLDIICLSFFPDYAHSPGENLVYLKNNGNFNFSANGLDLSSYGRFNVFDVGDLDQDGDQDIALGAFIMDIGEIPPPLLEKWRSNNAYLLIMKNKLK